MSFVIVLAALAFLMFVAYRGYSVILFAPVAALGAVLLTDPAAVAPVFTGMFMEKMVGFVKLYFPVFLLGARVRQGDRTVGFLRVDRRRRDPLRRPRARDAGRSSLVCALLTYGGVSLFVVVFAVYPFAAELFRQSDIPKRLIPGTIALGAFTFTMDSLPGTPQIQNIIPTTFFKTTTWAAPVLGVIGVAVHPRRRACCISNGAAARRMAAGEGYGTRPRQRAGARRGDAAAASVARDRCRWCWSASRTSC